MKTMIHAKRKRIPLAKIRGTHDVSKMHVQDLRESTRVKPPILVIESPSGKTFQILDGHHRTALARQQGRATILAFVVPRSVHRTHADDIDIVRLSPGRVVVAPMSLDDLIVVQWRGKRRRYYDMRGDDAYTTIDRKAIEQIVALNPISDRRRP